MRVVCVIYMFVHTREELIMEMADHMEADGYKKAGYVYVNLDVSK